MFGTTIFPKSPKNNTNSYYNVFSPLTNAVIFLMEKFHHFEKNIFLNNISTEIPSSLIFKTLSKKK